MFEFKRFFLTFLSVSVVASIPVPDDDAFYDARLRGALIRDSDDKVDTYLAGVEDRVDVDANDVDLDNNTTGNNTTPETTTDNPNNTTDNTAEIATLRLSADAVPPENVVTNFWGEPQKNTETLNFTVKGGNVEVITEFWKTYHTFPATKENCICLTRGPIAPFKLFGNLHFSRVRTKVTVVPTIIPTSTICPPCYCDNCIPNPHPSTENPTSTMSTNSMESKPAFLNNAYPYDYNNNNYYK